jgi:hypothetical protein
MGSGSFRMRTFTGRRSEVLAPASAPQTVAVGRPRRVTGRLVADGRRRAPAPVIQPAATMDP